MRRRGLASVDGPCGHVVVVALVLVPASPTGAQGHTRLSVAVTSADLEAIVKRVGAGEVDTFSLFRGCVLRTDLPVESSALDRLVTADAVVWSGLFHESSAIHASVDKLPPARRARLGHPQWIDVSRTRPA